MRVHVLASILIGILLISCSMAPTPASRPGNLDQLDLEALILPDFPPSLLAGTRFTEIDLRSPPKIANQYLRGIDAAGGASRGMIFVIVYWDPVEAQARYESELMFIDATDLPAYPYRTIALGEYAIVQPKRQWTKVQFVRCHAFVELLFDIPPGATLTYAEHLDARLKPVVCPEATPLQTPIRP